MVNSQVGGDGNTLYTLLLITKILYLPKTNVIKSPDMIDKYMDCIDSFTLIYLINKLELRMKAYYNSFCRSRNSITK